MKITSAPPISVRTWPGCMDTQRIPSGCISIAMQRLNMFRALWEHKQEIHSTEQHGMWSVRGLVSDFQIFIQRNMHGFLSSSSPGVSVSVHSYSQTQMNRSIRRHACIIKPNWQLTSLDYPVKCHLSHNMCSFPMWKYLWCPVGVVFQTDPFIPGELHRSHLRAHVNDCCPLDAHASCTVCSPSECSLLQQRQETLKGAARKTHVCSFPLSIIT